jgi:hypothetical protein
MAGASLPWYHAAFMDRPASLAPLRSFRDALSACFERRTDA